MRRVRAAVMSAVLPGITAEIHTSRPCSSARPRTPEAVVFVLAAVVASVLGAGAAAGTDQGAVHQHHHCPLGAQAPQGSVQPGSPGGEQADDFEQVAAQGGRGDLVRAGQVQQPFVLAQHRQHQHRLLPGGDLAPAGPDPFPVHGDHAGQPGDRGHRHRQRTLVGDHGVGL